MFCSACTRLFAGRAEKISPGKEGPFQAIHHPDLASFRLARDQGCGICCKAWLKFKTDGLGKETISRDIIITALAEPISLSGTKTINVLQFDEWERKDYDNRMLSVLTTDGIKEGTWITFKGVSYLHTHLIGFEMIPTDRIDRRSIQDFGSNSQSPESYSIVRQWMRSCLDDHLPHKPSQASFFPDRVLDIGVQGDQVIKLLNRHSKVAKDVNYATLSYCWGDSNHLKLEMATLKRFEGGLNATELPRTMQHAVALTREVGLRYLWIDSLCIIQDSIDDWRAQSALMGSIYQHSHINIAASSSKNSEGGLKFNRDPQSVLPSQITCRFPFDVATKPNQLYNIMLQKPYYEAIEQEPLNSRGWVMQERLLAPRTVHCTKDQLYWECDHKLANESHPDGFTTTLDRQPGEFSRMLSRFSQPSTAVIDDIHPEPAIAWLSLIREYTKCELTRDEDILIAISGLAKRWNEILPGEYLAGLWTQYLAEGLLWHGEGKMPKYLGGEAASKWRAPSWSWAAYKGAVSWSPNVIPYENFPSSVISNARLIEKLGTGLTSGSADKFGQQAVVFLIIRAALSTALIGFGSHTPSGFQGGTANNESVREQWERVYTHGAKARRIVMKTATRQFAGFCYFDNAKLREKLDKERSLSMTCMPIMLYFLSFGNSKDGVEVDIELQGIILETVPADQTYGKCFQRVGYFSVRSKLGDERTVRTFHASLVGQGWEIPSKLGFGKPEDIVLY